MGLNVSTSMGFENSTMLRNTAKNILEQNGAKSDVAAKIAGTAIFANEQAYTNSQLSVLKASTQITLNTSLNETLKYLKAHAIKKTVKTPVLGELWDIFTANNSASDETVYQGELIDFTIDANTKNFFAA